MAYYDYVFPPTRERILAETAELVSERIRKGEPCKFTVEVLPPNDGGPVAILTDITGERNVS